MIRILNILKHLLILSNTDKTFIVFNRFHCEYEPSELNVYGLLLHNLKIIRVRRRVTFPARLKRAIRSGAQEAPVACRAVISTRLFFVGLRVSRSGRAGFIRRVTKYEALGANGWSVSGEI